MLIIGIIIGFVLTVLLSICLAAIESRKEKRNEIYDLHEKILIEIICKMSEKKLTWLEIVDFIEKLQDLRKKECSYILIKVEGIMDQLRKIQKEIINIDKGD